MSLKINNNQKVISFEVLKQNSKQTEKQTPIAKSAIKDKAKIVPFEIVQVYSGNIVINKIASVLSKLFKKSKMNLTPEQIQKAVQKYCADCSLMKDVPKQALEFYGDFEKAIQNSDFSDIEKVKSMWDAPPESFDEYLICRDLGMPLESGVEKETILNQTQMIRQYAYKLCEDTPYSIYISYSMTSEREKICEQVIVSKDGNTILFTPSNFLKSVTQKKLSGDNLISLESPENDNYSYSYSPEGKMLFKTEKATQIAMGCICADDIDEKGNPKFTIDEDFASGITYYASTEYAKDNIEIALETAFGLDEDEIIKAKQAEDLIENDKKARELYEEGYSPYFILSCIRNGELNEKVFKAKDRFFNMLEDKLNKIAFIDYDFAEEIFTMLEDEDFNHNPLSLDVASGFIAQKARLDIENNEFIKEVSLFFDDNPTKENYETLNELSNADYLSPEEIETLFKILKLFNLNQKEAALYELDKLAQNSKDWTYKEALNIFSAFFKKFI